MPRSRVVAAYVPVFAAVCILLGQRDARADKITIDRCHYDVNTKKYALEISGAPATTAITIKIHPRDGGQPVVVTPNGAKTDGDGKYKDAAIDGTKGTSFSIEIGEEIWRGIVRLDKGAVLSKRQIADKLKGQGRGGLGGLPLTVASSAYFADTVNVVVDQIQIANTSHTNAYMILSLQVYRDLDGSYFDGVDFASSSAIATGVLDGSADSLIVPRAGGIGDSMIVVNPNPIRMGRYELVVGTAAPMLTDSTLGSSTSFAFARRGPASLPIASPVTAAASACALLLLALGALLMRDPVRRSGFFAGSRRSSRG